MSLSDRYYVRTDRDDGSRVYTGPLSHGRAQREYEARAEAWPHYSVVIVPAGYPATADVRRAALAQRDGGRYYPAEVAS